MVASWLCLSWNLCHDKLCKSHGTAYKKKLITTIMDLCNSVGHMYNGNCVTKRQVILGSRFLLIEKGHCFKVSTAQDLKLKQLEKEFEAIKKSTQNCKRK